MKIELDVHTHTVASGHAYSTLQEMAKAGAEKGLKILGITEHTSGIPGACDPIYFRNLHVVPRRMYGVELLLGAEINILDSAGNIDADADLMSRLDLRIAGIHLLCYQHGTKEENTQGMIKPNIVFFGEMPLYMDKIEPLLRSCDLFVSVGTSGVVYPAAGFVQTAKYYGATTVEINLDPVLSNFHFDKHITGKAGEVLPQFVDELLKADTTELS